MTFIFEKYQGTGNDFVIIDDKEKKFPIHNTSLIEKICDRRFGVGADGLILVHPEPAYDFRMVYFNSDGRESTMCGNGGRCFAQFLSDKKLVSKTDIEFIAIDGPHKAIIDHENALVHLKMIDVSEIEYIGTDFHLNTGSPHYVIPYTGKLEELALVEEARKIRNSDRFKEAGVNVNFFSQADSHLAVRTYERGVEGETYSCGTGVTAVALSSKAHMPSGEYMVPITTPGGNLNVRFRKSHDASFEDIWLIGPAENVFSGTIKI